jgi:hypothetical protein
VGRPDANEAIVALWQKYDAGRSNDSKSISSNYTPQRKKPYIGL